MLHVIYHAHLHTVEIKVTHKVIYMHVCVHKLNIIAGHDLRNKSKFHVFLQNAQPQIRSRSNPKVKTEVQPIC